MSPAAFALVSGGNTRTATGFAWRSPTCTDGIVNSPDFFAISWNCHSVTCEVWPFKICTRELLER